MLKKKWRSFLKRNRKKRKKRIVSGYYFDGNKLTILYEKRR